MLRRHSDMSVNQQPQSQVWDTRCTVYRLTAALTRLRSTVRHRLDAVLQQAEYPKSYRPIFFARAIAHIVVESWPGQDAAASMVTLSRSASI
jgi:hypothetical protein